AATRAVGTPSHAGCAAAAVRSGVPWSTGRPAAGTPTRSHVAHVVAPGLDDARNAPRRSTTLHRRRDEAGALRERCRRLHRGVEGWPEEAALQRRAGSVAPHDGRRRRVPRVLPVLAGLRTQKSPRPLHERETGGLTPAKTRLVLVGVHLEVSYVEPARVPARVDDLDAVADLAKSGVAGDQPLRHQVVGELLDVDRAGLGLRSEEHMSELQSRENIVCRLLLE